MAHGLERRGYRVVGLDTSLSGLRTALFAGAHLFGGYGWPYSREAIFRSPAARRYRAQKLAEALQLRRIEQVLHTGTLDMVDSACANGTAHYLYCDNTWHLASQYRSDMCHFTRRALRNFDALERDTYAHIRHIFTFASYVRDDLIGHYGVPEDRVTVVGSGMGPVRPYDGPKDYRQGRLLFIAKHYFVEKGGRLLMDALRIAQRERSDLRLTVIGGAHGQARLDVPPNVRFLPFVSVSELERQLRRATLLIQPMLSDPWGQVYLEALVSRTPVLGLRRNGLPEITCDGTFGFLVDEARPEAIAAAILDALSDPRRLAEMGGRGQDHVARLYSWEMTAQRIAAVLAQDD